MAKWDGLKKSLTSPTLYSTLQKGSNFDAKFECQCAIFVLLLEIAKVLGVIQFRIHKKSGKHGKHVYGSEFWTMYNWVQTWGKIKISEVLRVLRATYLA